MEILAVPLIFHALTRSGRSHLHCTGSNRYAKGFGGSYGVAEWGAPDFDVNHGEELANRTKAILRVLFDK